MAEATGSSKAGTRMVTGLFRDRESAERAYGSLNSRGYSNDDFNMVMSDETRKKHFSDDNDTELDTKAWEGAGKGAAIGTTVALPGLGLLVAGPIAAALAGAGTGGAIGGLIGGLVGSGIPEDRAKEYDRGVREGGILMGVNARSDEDAEFFESEWKNSRGENVYR